jgi:hypothetical protein
MATKEQPKGTRPMDRKSMKHTRGGIIVVCKTADAVAGPNAAAALMAVTAIVFANALFIVSVPLFFVRTALLCGNTWSACLIGDYKAGAKSVGHPRRRHTGELRLQEPSMR